MEPQRTQRASRVCVQDGAFDPLVTHTLLFKQTKQVFCKFLHWDPPVKRAPFSDTLKSVDEQILLLFQRPAVDPRVGSSASLSIACRRRSVIW